MTTNRPRIEVNRVPKSMVAYLCVIRGLTGTPIFLEKDEALELIEALSGALGLYVHLPGGCEDDGCPCRQRHESQGR